MTDNANIENLFYLLASLDVEYTLYEHRPLFRVADGEEIEQKMPGAHCRNLFLRDKKKNNFLFTAMNETPIDLKAAQKALGCGRLSFGSPERLWETLGVRPGSVCPFAVINDTDRCVQVVLDIRMMKQPLVNYHPLVNTMTIGLHPDGLIKFLTHTGHRVEMLDFTNLKYNS